MLYPQAAAPHAGAGRVHMAARLTPINAPAPLSLGRPAVTARVAQLEQPGTAAAPAPAEASTSAATTAPTTASAPAQQQQQQQQQQRRGRNGPRRPSQWTDGRGSQPANSYRVLKDANVAGLSKAIRLNAVLNSGAADAKLRLVCQEPEAVPRAIQAVAQANSVLAQENSEHRLQVSSSVARRYGVTLYRTLSGEAFTAFLFVSRVPAASIPALPADKLEQPIRLSRSTVWEKLAGYLQVAMTQGGPQATLLVSCVGFALLTNAYKSLMLARYNLVRGSTANSGAPASSGTDAAAAPAPASAAAPAVDAPKDFAIIPTLQFDQVSEGTLLTATRLQVVACEPPAPSASAEYRLATPRPSRAASPRRSDTTNSSGPRRAGAPRPRAAADASGNTVTVAADEWNSMKERLETMVDQHKQLMAMLQQTMGPDAAAQAVATPADAKPAGSS